MRRSRIVVCPLALVLACGASARPGDGPADLHPEHEELWEIGGCVVDAGPFDPGAVRGVISAPVTTILNNGPSANRVDLVFVGDGYQAGQMAAYETHVQTAMTALFDQEPFKTYKPLFNAHRVTVISTDSGVDNDPTQGILRNTALDMLFWCGGTERLLCVSVSKAYDYALNAPDVDQVFAVANSTKYGGAGYTSNDLGTYSGGNGSSAEVAIHELGHSFGDLADEYDYGGPETYVGPERPEPNASIRTAGSMASLQTKWWRWLNVNNPTFDGLVSTFEGCYYSPMGVYRPTNNSKMRNLGRPFNYIGMEALIANMYLEVDPIDGATPPSSAWPASLALLVDPVDPVGAPLSVQWRLNGDPIPGATATTFLPSSLTGVVGPQEISVKVVDNTPWVRDPAIRDARMTAVRSWTVIFPQPGDVNGDGFVTFQDVNIVLGQWQQTGGALIADLNDDGVVDFEDLNIVLSNYGG